MPDVIRRGYVRQVARRLRRDARIEAPPVDLRLVAAACGLGYEEVDYFPDEVDALIVCSDTRNVAVVNKTQSETRRRFSLAHEIGHYLLHRNGTDFRESVTIDSPPTEADDACGGSVTEQEANLFGRELLIPIEFLKASFRPGMLSLDIARCFAVSESVAAIAVSAHMRALFGPKRRG